METDHQGVFVEIVAKKKGCMLCDLAIGILEEISPEFDEGMLKWDVVDVGDRDGLARFDELTNISGRRPAVPSIVINERIAFDHIPDFEALSEAVRQAMIV
jgi:glutaredoxin